jgi:hypothetical protein
LFTYNLFFFFPFSFRLISIIFYTCCVTLTFSSGNMPRTKQILSSFFFPPCHPRSLPAGTREGELQASTRTPLSLHPRFSSPKGVLDWLSNVDTTTAELRNHVRHSTWSLIELSGISPALLQQLAPNGPAPFQRKCRTVVAHVCN